MLSLLGLGLCEPCPLQDSPCSELKESCFTSGQHVPGTQPKEMPDPRVCRDICQNLGSVFVCLTMKIPFFAPGVPHEL